MAEIPPAVTSEQIIELITSRYTPAIDLADSDIQFTTLQILEQISAHYGSVNLSMEQLANGLKLAGFQTDIIPANMQHVWVMRFK